MMVFCLSKINYENRYGFEVNGVKHVVQAQNVFHHLVRNAQSIGMKVNTDKTVMICFSDSSRYKADTFIEDAESNRLCCGDSLKALGMCFLSKADMLAHADWIQGSMRTHLCILHNLKKSGFTSEELVTV